ncbi:MAG: hypothetical protein WCQ95_00380 [Bacteroidota bacterium]
MKKKKCTNLISAVVIAVFSITTGFAQVNDQNNGAECGCPAVDTRNPVDLGTLGVALDANQVEIQVDRTLTCDNLYTFDKKIYVANGVTLTIEPGTVLKGAYIATATHAAAIIVERGGKIIANGKPNCKIIMTGMADPLDGTYSVTNVGDWGGLVICGFATNNLSRDRNMYVAGVNTKKGTKWNGVGYIEGADNTVKTLWGAGDSIVPNVQTVFNDDDNSGILRYVSVRHAGALLSGNSAGNELNGISLYSVGRGTKIDHCETVAAADDNFEMFGGTVDLKYCSTLYGDDDFFDYDLGWTGRMQFCFGIAGDSLTGLHSTDNGYEADADDDGSCTTFDRSHPLIYNTTLIGNGHMKPTADNKGPAAIQAKELTEGEFINNVFVNFRSGLHLSVARSTTGPGKGGDAYDNWSDNTTAYVNPTYPTGSGYGAAQNAKYHSLIVKNNTFVHCNLVNNAAPNGASYWITKGNMTAGSNPATFATATPASAADTLQFFNDGNRHPATVPGIDWNWAWNTGHTDFTANKYYAVPSSNLTSTMTPPNDGFFDVVSYRGAFDATRSSWLSTDNGFMLPVASKLQNGNPTDLNNDGITDINDFSIFIGKFGQLDQ